jgi:hypothetical protein
MSIEYLYVHFEDKNGAPIDADVQADGQAEGPANKMMILEAGSYMISLDSTVPCQPKEVALVLGGTTQTRPKVLVFQPT